ncbi:MAG: zinc ABC transporter substrate-binding protein [Gemmataceae bacterium]|nr:zinc ABC transporter substrate-binding protein [Gemmataceae bacterium]
MRLRQQRYLGGLTCAILLLFLAGCGNGEGNTQSGAKGHRHAQRQLQVDRTWSGAYPIGVVCTTGMVADLVRNVGGTRVQVTQLMGEGVDPHRYEVSSGDVTRLDGADIIFYSGLHLEGKMADLFERLSKRRPTFAVTEYIDRKYILEDEEHSDDPHSWFDVSLWSQAAGVVRDVLMKYDPTHAAEYRANADAYQAKLVELHAYAKKELAAIPKERRVLVTAHDAFRYFGRAYDVEVRGIQGISTADEAGLKDIEELVDFIVRRKIKAVFTETSVSAGHMRALIEGCRARGHAVAEGGKLYSDAMGAEGTAKGTYVGMVRHNVDTIVQALR